MFGLGLSYRMAALNHPPQPAEGGGGPSGPIVVANQAERQALTGLTPGQLVNQTDNGGEYQWNGPNGAYAGLLMGNSGNNSSLFLFTMRANLNGKPRFQPISYVFDEAPAVWGVLWTGTAWNIYDNQEAILYTSPDDVAYPWLATFVAGPAGSNPPPVLTALTQGDLDAGCRASGATGVGSVCNGDYTPRGSHTTGAVFYNKKDAATDQYEEAIAQAFFHSDGVESQSMYLPATSPAHLPWLVSYVGDFSGGTPPTVIRLDAIHLGNWTQLNPS